MQEPSTLFVCLMGVGTVFIGLVCIVLICTLLSLISRTAFKGEAAVKTEAPAAESDVNRQEMIAAISAAIAEASGKDMSAIRILSVKKL